MASIATIIYLGKFLKPEDLYQLALPFTIILPTQNDSEAAVTKHPTKLILLSIIVRSS